MSKATDQELAALHGKLAKAYQRALENEEVSPALLTSAANFLKNNGISCVTTEDDELKQLREKVTEKMAFPFDPKEAKDGVHH